MVFYACATWGNAGFMREAVCKYMCPYARFQSVMVDDDTFVVTYDYVRSEPRGGRSRRIDHKEAGIGECVECSSSDARRVGKECGSKRRYRWLHDHEKENTARQDAG